ncbi:MAG: cyanophycin synthetase [Candidatus Saccharimonadales bacterium]|nr:cyanophycin synthetase [Candidatus Saccharimonadales bacterium]
MKVSSFDEAVEFLYKTVPKTAASAFTGDKALTKSQRFFNELDNVQDARPTIHIAATSGKGTIAHMIEAVLRAHGLSTATLTSPHVYKITERVRINSQPIFEHQFTNYLNQLIPAYESLRSNQDAPTYFEMNMAIGWMAAQENNVDCCIVETGFGGAMDTSNVINREDKINVIGQIGLDHTEILGNTIDLIAEQKAGIIHRQQTVVALRQKPIVNDAIKRAAESNAAHVIWVRPDAARAEISNLSQINPSLAGSHQYSNLALAAETSRQFLTRENIHFDHSKLLDAISRVQIPGRFEIIQSGGKTFIFDGAHNEQKLDATLGAVRERFGQAEFGVVFASGQKALAKDLAEIAQRQAAEIILTRYRSEALDMFKPAYDYRNFAKRKGLTFTNSHRRIAELIGHSSLNIWLITGSFYILSDLKKALLGD